MDLSQQKNVESARQVFDPFVKNKPVLMDMAYTAYMDQQETIAENDKYANSGKDFNEWSVKAMRKQRADFANDDINNVGEYYSNRVSYKKYYDWNKEVMEKMKEFKPSSIQTEQQNGMYLVKTKNESWTKEEISQYLESVLSDNAKSQMRLEASVLYPDPQSAAGLYATTASEALPVIQSEIDRLQTALKIEKNPEKRKLIKDKADRLTDRSNSLSRDLQNIANGDVSFFKSNWQNMASAIYINNKVSSLSKGFSHQDISQDVTPDQVSMMYARMAFDREEKRLDRIESRLNREESRKARLAEEEKEQVSGDIIPMTRPGETVTTTGKTLNEQVKSAQKNADSQFQELKEYMTTQDAFRGKSANSLSRTEVQEWVKAHQDHPEVIKFQNAEILATTRRMNLEQWDKSAENYAREQMGAERYNQLVEWRKYSGQKAPGEKVDRTSALFQPLPITNSDIRNPMFSREGKVMRSSRDMFQTNNNINGIDLERQYNSLKESFNSKANTVGVSMNTQGFTKNANSKEYKDAIGDLEAITGLNNKISAIRWFPTLNGYDITFKVDDATSKTPLDRKKIIADLKTSLGTDNIKYDEQTGVFTLGKLGDKISPNLDPFKGLSPLMKEVMSSIDMVAGKPGQKRSTAIIPITGKAGTYSVYITKQFGTSVESDKYILYINNKSVDTSFESSLDAINSASVLINSPERLSVILNGN